MLWSWVPFEVGGHLSWLQFETKKEPKLPIIAGCFKGLEALLHVHKLAEPGMACHHDVISLLAPPS